MDRGNGDGEMPLPAPLPKGRMVGGIGSRLPRGENLGCGSGGGTANLTVRREADEGTSEVGVNPN